jgi:microcystin-dependent protein
MRIDSAGNVGIGKAPTVGLDVAGQIRTDSSIVLSNGSLATPALNFGAGTGTDTNTGIYHPADNTIGVVINGSETARFTGTSFAAQAMSTVTLSTATITAGQGTAGAPSYTFNGDGDTGVYSPAANTVAVTTGGSERMRIDSAGNVGIGTAADASYKLDVTNDSRFRNALFVTPATSGLGTIRLTTDAGQSYIQSGSNTGSSSNKLYFTGIFGVNTTMVADMVNQRVRIGGGTDPTVALDVTGQIKTDNSILLGNGSAAAPSMTFTSDTNTGIYRNAENELSLSTDGAERLRVGLSEQRMYFGEAGGAYTSFAKDNITIGQGRTGNDFAYLDLVGDISNTDYGLRLLRGNVGSNSGSELSHRGTGNLTINASDAAPILFQTQSLERLRITSDGNVGVGTASPGSYKLNVNGNTNVTGDLNVTGNITGSSSVMPAGSITAYGGSSAPTGWLLCNGSAVSRTTYAALFTAISSNYGNGDGVNTFNVPNIGDRFPIGKGSDVSSNTLGYTSGSKTHTLTTAEIPSHSHTQQRITAGYAASFNSNEEVFSVSRDNGIEPFTTGSAGGGGAHNNMPPYIVVNYIIKT